MPCQEAFAQAPPRPQPRGREGFHTKLPADDGVMLRCMCRARTQPRPAATSERKRARHASDHAPPSSFRDCSGLVCTGLFRRSLTWQATTIDRGI